MLPLRSATRNLRGHDHRSSPVVVTLPLFFYIKEISYKEYKRKGHHPHHWHLTRSPADGCVVTHPLRGPTPCPTTPTTHFYPFVFIPFTPTQHPRPDHVRRVRVTQHPTAYHRVVTVVTPRKKWVTPVLSTAQRLTDEW